MITEKNQALNMDIDVNVDVIEKSFDALAPHGQLIVDAFYKTMFSENPEVKPFFANTNMAEQKKHLLSSLVLAVNNLRKPEVLLPALEELGARHVDYGTKPEHYPIVKMNMIKAMSSVAGDIWTTEVDTEWNKLLDNVSRIMISGAEKRMGNKKPA